MNLKRLLFFSVLFLLTYCMVVGAGELIVERFEEASALSLTGENIGAGSSLELVGAPVKEGQSAVKLNYNFVTGTTLSYVGVAITKTIPITFGTLGFWAYGDSSGNALRVRVYDATGETFQYTIGAINWSGWQWKECELGPISSHWGGNNDNIIDAPLQKITLLVDRGPMTSGAVYFDELTITAQLGTIKGRVTDEIGQPVSGARISLADSAGIGTNTDAEGRYSLLVAPGIYTLQVEKIGYETKQKSQVTVETDTSVTVDFSLIPAPDLGVYSDKGMEDENGLFLARGGDGWNGKTVAVGERTAVATSGSTGNAYLYYKVDDSYIFDGSNDVYLTIEYYDLGFGSIGLHYDSDRGDTTEDRFRSAGSFERNNTLKWKVHTFHLTDARFANRTNSCDFRISTDRQPDAIVGRVGVVKAGKVLALDAVPSIISPGIGGTTEIFYRLSSPGIVSAWVEDKNGLKIASLLEGRDEETVTGSITWAGRTDEGEIVADGTYFIKLTSSGLAWDKSSSMMVAVAVDSIAPAAPQITTPSTGFVTNEPQILLMARGQAALPLRFYLNGSIAGETRADGRGIASFLVQGLVEGTNQLTVSQVDYAGNESEHSPQLEVTVNPSYQISQVTISYPEFAPPATTSIRFFLSGTEDLSLVLTDNSGAQLGHLSALVQKSGEVSFTWDGKLNGNVLSDGKYWIEIRRDASLLGKAQVIIDTTFPPAPILLLPALGATVSEATPLLKWEGAPAVKGYRLKIWQEGAEPVIFEEDVFLPQFQVDGSLKPGSWLWQVEAIGATGLSTSSPVGFFTINWSLPQALQISNLQGAPNPFVPNGNGRYEEFHLVYSLSQPAFVTISIYNLAGGEVYRRVAVPEGVGDHYLTWNGRDNNGRLVAKGIYLLVVHAENEQNDAPARARKLISVLY